MRRQLGTGLMMTLAMIVLLGLVYPLAMTGAAQLIARDKANGSFVSKDGKVVGSSLIGQAYTDKDGNPIPRYFQSRPSAGGYDALASGGTNDGPSSTELINRVKASVVAYRALNGLPKTAMVPVDAVTASASGLDPAISIANARLQAPRVARTRALPLSQVLALVKAHTEDWPLGILGEPTVNVLNLNLALDAMH